MYAAPRRDYNVSLHVLYKSFILYCHSALNFDSYLIVSYPLLPVKQMPI